MVTVFLLMLGLAIQLQAGQPVIWETSGRAELLKGEHVRFDHRMEYNAGA